MTHRPFRLADAMVLVVAVATGLSVNRASRLASFPRPKLDYYSIAHLLNLVLPHVATTTVALVVMQLLKPRPAFRRLARQPGAIACMVASAVLVLIACWAAITAVTGRVVEFSQHVTLLPNRGGQASVALCIQTRAGG